MQFELKHPEIIEITDGVACSPSYGPDQIWFRNSWRQKSGCGPTAAALITAYLAMTRPSLRALYPAQKMDKASFSDHMETMFTFVTPGVMGLNRLEPFAEGVKTFAFRKGVSLYSHILQINGIEMGSRDPMKELVPFVEKGLESDLPIALLVLANGMENRLQNWHWITITEFEIADGRLNAAASDEGIRRTFDLGLWYETTPLSGGLVYFSGDSEDVKTGAGMTASALA